MFTNYVKFVQQTKCFLFLGDLSDPFFVSSSGNRIFAPKIWFGLVFFSLLPLLFSVAMCLLLVVPFRNACVSFGQESGKLFRADGILRHQFGQTCGTLMRIQ